MSSTHKAIIENFGQQNIDSIKENLEHSEKKLPRRAFTMIHSSSRTDITITPESRMICGRAIIR